MARNDTRKIKVLMKEAQTQGSIITKFTNDILAGLIIQITTPMLIE
jgi:hypothetical protein